MYNRTYNVSPLIVQWGVHATDDHVFCDLLHFFVWICGLVLSIKQLYSDPIRAPLEIEVGEGKNEITVEVKKIQGAPDF